MKPTYLSLSDWNNAPVHWTGIFSIECRLFVDFGRQCWLADSYEDFVSERRVAIPNCEQITDLIGQIFPPYGGGRAFFIVECEAELELERGGIVSISKFDLKMKKHGYYLSIERFASGMAHGIVSSKAPRH